MLLRSLVYHAPEFTYSNVHLLPKISHLLILSGGSCGCSLVPFSLYKDQDQIKVHSPCVERRYIDSLSVNNEKVGQVRISLVKTKAEFLIIQNLIQSYVRVNLISHILLFSTVILIYWQRGEDLN